MRALSGKEPKVNLSELLTGTEPVNCIRAAFFAMLDSCGSAISYLVGLRRKRFDHSQACKVSILWLIVSTAEMAWPAGQWT